MGLAIQRQVVSRWMDGLGHQLQLQLQIRRLQLGLHRQLIPGVAAALAWPGLRRPLEAGAAEGVMEEGLESLRLEVGGWCDAVPPRRRA